MTSQKIRKVREYRDCYRKSKKQVKKHVCRILYTNRKHLKKKNRLDKRKCINKLHQRRIDEKMIILKCRQIVDENENLLKRNNNFHKYL